MLYRFFRRPGLSAFRPLLTLLAILASTCAFADSRIIQTAYGEVSLTGTPERIVTLYEGALDAAIAAGAKPLGAVVTRGGTSTADYIQPQTRDIQIVGTPAEFNLEAIIRLNPDIILAASQLTRDQYQLLSQIAPTIVPDATPFTADTWKQETRLFAAALNREEAGEAAITRVENRIRELSELLDASLPQDQREAALVRWMPQGPLMMTSGLFSATLLEAVGFRMEDAGIVKPGRPHSNPLSLENLNLIDQHWLFLATLNADGKEALDAARKSPAFERLRASRENRVLTVNGQLWTSASGPIAAETILNELHTALTGGQFHL